MKDYRDFYITWEGHPRYNSTEIITDSKIRLMINKMEMIIFTNKGEFAGDLNFGADIPKYIWQTNVSDTFIKNTLIEQFEKYIPEIRNYNYRINLELIEGGFIGQDGLIIDIYYS